MSESKNQAQLAVVLPIACRCCHDLAQALAVRYCLDPQHDIAWTLASKILSCTTLLLRQICTVGSVLAASERSP